MTDYRIIHARQNEIPPRPKPGTLVSCSKRGVGIILPHQEITPRAYVLVRFNNGEEHTVRISDLDSLESEVSFDPKGLDKLI